MKIDYNDQKLNIIRKKEIAQLKKKIDAIKKKLKQKLKK